MKASAVVKNGIFQLLKITIQFSIDSPDCTLSYLIIIFFDYSYFILRAITFHGSSKTEI